MSLAAALSHPKPPQPVLPGRGNAVVRLTIHDNFPAAEKDWRALEAAGALATPYQRFDFLAPWQRHLGAANGIRPCIVVGHDEAGRPALLLPLGFTRIGPLRVARFLGGKHANFNMALCRTETIAGLDAQELTQLIRGIAAQGPRLDLLALTNQPFIWNGRPNPLALLPHQPSPSFACCCTLRPDYEALVRALAYRTRKKLKRKERELASHGEVRLIRGDDEAARAAIQAAFLRQKTLRMRELGIDNTFARPGTAEFVAALSRPGADGAPPVLELHALAVDGEMISTYAGLAHEGRWSGFFNSMTDGPLAAASPGELLLARLVESCCVRGFDRFDLGVGEAAYKKTFCDEVEPLFDSFLPLTQRGRLAVAVLRAHYNVKRLIKQQPALWRGVESLRRLRARLLRNA